ncbi:ABC transporter permease subunit/CPBP intramembrane protease [Novipirellula artificiosorum]|uniref:ABC-2 family transporter protein n=1 Tax=Novipirellula artificiosorum TaxID=2528016 RepID=A0A5C6E1H5_9BACT|nr:ABC transporter permease subunit/CPBP intramembrane protease [Novipirellula artificiosorum]TWU42708.1 ABC-2 family transporter protein [Novipirellula artificiosorum]
MSGNTTQSRILRLCQKELRETIRDRRTVATLLLMPLLLYPLLSMALNRFLLTSDVGAANVFLVGLASEQEGELLTAYLNDPNSQPPDSILQSSSGDLANFDMRLIENQDPVDALKENVVDVAVSIKLGDTPEFTITAYQGDGASETARRILVERLQWVRSNIAQRFATEHSDNYRPPAEVFVRTVGDSERMPLLATIVPLVLVLMTITGAVYPAIDLTAGERERGTMESLMASPVPRFYVLFAKYVAVVIVALLTAMINLLAMFTTLWASGMLRFLTGNDAFPWTTVLQILGLLVLFSGFFSALLLSLTSFAKSFKEAQAYLIPVMLLALAPAMLSLMPGVKLSGPLAIAPLISIVLLARDLLAGTFQPVGALAAVISTVAYAAAALAIAARLFGNDAVMRTSEQSIGSFFKRPQKITAVPSVQSAALMLALLVPIYFVGSNGLMRFLQAARDEITMSTQFVLNALTLALTFGLVPLAAAYLGRNRLRTTFRLSMPSVISLIGAFLVGLGAWAIAHESYVLAQSLGIGGLSEQRIKDALGQLEAWKQVSPWLLLFTFAFAPAVIEELCFRGFLFSSLSTALSPPRVILLTAVLFGLFHVLTGNALLIERFIPTTLLGAILGWVAYRTGSVIPGMLMHFVHNGLLELVGRYHERIDFFGSDLNDQAHLPTAWLLGTAAIAMLGACLIVWSTRNRFAEQAG